MLANKMKEKISPKKALTPKSEGRKRKNSGADDLTQEDISDLLGLPVSTPKEVKKAKVTTPKSAKKQTPAKVAKSPARGEKSPKVEPDVPTESQSQKKKRKSVDDDDEDEVAKKSEKNGAVSEVSASLKKRKKSGGEKKKEEEEVVEEEVEGLEQLQAEQEKRKAEDNKRHLYVTGLSERVAEADLRKLSADVVDATIKTTFLKKKDGGPKFVAYLKFESESAVDRNIEKLRGKKVKGCELEVDYVGEKSDKFKAQHNGETKKASADIDTKRLYVTGFNKEAISEEKLKEAFEGCSEVSLPMKKKEKVAVGYALVTFKEASVCRGYFEREGGVEVDGCKLTVCFARTKKS